MNHKAAIHAIKSKLVKQVLEYTGAALSALGALLLACNINHSYIGWWFFFAANLALIAHARLLRAHGLLVMQCVFAFTSVLGMVRSVGFQGLLRY